MRPKKCPECGDKYQPVRQLQPCCDKDGCKLSYAICHAEKAKSRRKMRKVSEQVELARADREKKESMKSIGELTKEAQKEFNAYIRMRDKLAGYPCISSGKTLNWTGNAVDAGHYRSTGSAPHLRFDERNCHAQSKHDNRYLAGNAVDYRIGLIARIGLEAVEALEADQTPRRYTKDDLRTIRDGYRAKVRQMKKEAG